MLHFLSVSDKWVIGAYAYKRLYGFRYMAKT